MKIEQNISLKKYNTFGVQVYAKRFVTIHSFYDLQELIKTEKELFLLSGGSNMLLIKDIEKLVAFIDIKGISIDKEDQNSVHVTVNSGENWHEFVLWCISQNYGGLENLSLIPGNVGTCPIQNIGAYGVEVKETITRVECLEISSGKRVHFSNNECDFGYRNSIFKNEAKGKNIITSVSFQLTKSTHKLNTSYGAIETALQEKNITNPTIKDISDAVIAIRKSKLPDPKEIGNCGSFFKNPVIATTQFYTLQKKHPTVPFYKVETQNLYKIPAGWLIEQSGFKGMRFGDAGVHTKQALVLVNHGNATGLEIYQLAQKIQQTVLDKFEIFLEIEVNVI
ncbi:MAG: UDP-N-acetylmuramate dehydrogenase [Polaribacter sp.]|nr:UDP-N-acetylmuramate dehydrogenase [Polaribacter sp.]